MSWLSSLARPHGRHRATAAPAPAFTEPQSGIRWLVCDTTTCAHLTQPHTPQPDGTWACVCGDIKGER